RDVADPAARRGRLVAAPRPPGAAGLRLVPVVDRLPARHVRGRRDVSGSRRRPAAGRRDRRRRIVGRGSGLGRGVRRDAAPDVGPAHAAGRRARPTVTVRARARPTPPAWRARPTPLYQRTASTTARATPTASPP